MAFMPAGLRHRLRLVRQVKAIEPDYLASEYAQAIICADRKRLASLPNDPVAIAKLSAFDSRWTHFANDLMSRQRAKQGIEARSPMLSRQFIEFCASLPEDLKRKGAQNRWIHRQAMKGVLPQKILDRTDKAQFPACLETAQINYIFAEGVPDLMGNLLNSRRFVEFWANPTLEKIEENSPFAVWGLFIARQWLLDYYARK
jgi:asparagine synthase (glutamine-hydrolysing)